MNFFTPLSYMETEQEDILERVRRYAEEAHGDQKRKFSHEPYKEHLIRVMEIVRQYQPELPLLSAALLHDILEDTSVTGRELEIFLSEIMTKAHADATFKLVSELTDVYIKRDYPMLNRQTRRQRESERLALTSGDAHTIKYADIIDNVLDISRHDTDFALVYIRESKQLLQMINKGNPELYARAAKTVDECLREYWNKSNVRAL